LEEIYHEYKDWEVWDLVDKSHKGPWKEVRGELDDWESSNKEIDLPKLIKFAINGYLEDERILGKKDSLTIKEIQTGVQEIKSILENTSKSERKAEFFRKLSQLSPWELAEIHDTERIMDSLKKVRIKH
jgi:uncharacterized phage-associated protein